MQRLLRPLTAAVGARPGVIVLLVLLVTAMLGALAPRNELVNDQAAFSPRTPEVLAQAELQERFSDADTATLQVVVEGDDVVSADGAATVATIQQVAVAELGDALLSGPGAPPVVSFLLPAQQAAMAMGQDLTAVDDATVDQLQRAAIEGPPPGAAGDQPPAGQPGAGGRGADLANLAVSLVGGEDPTDASAGLVLLTLDRSAFASDEALVAAELAFVDALAAAGTPLTAIPFSFDLVAAPDADFEAEVGRLFGLAALVILVILALVLRARTGRTLSRAGAVRRSVADMALSMVAVVLAIVWSQGFAVLLGPEFLDLIGAASPPTQIVPILLLALGVSYAIHTFSRYREELAGGAEPSPADVVRGLGPSVGVALLLSMLTTGFGFLTNITSPIPAIADLGVVAAIGIVAVFLVTITFLPAARLLLDGLAERRGRLVREEVAPTEGAALGRVAKVGLRPALRAPVAMLSAAAVLAGAGAYGLTQLDTVFSLTAFLPEDSPFVRAFEVLDEEFGGGLAETTSALVTGEAVLTPAHHDALGEVPERLDGDDGVVVLGGRVDVSTPRTALAQAQSMPPAGPAQEQALAEAIGLGLQPDGGVAVDGDVAAIYRAMAAAFPTVAGTVDLDADVPAIKVTVRTQSEAAGVEVVQANVVDAVAPLADAGAEVVVTSDAIIGDDILDGLSSSQVTGLLVTVLAVMLLLVLVYGVRDRRPVLGVLVTLPVAVVVLWVFGLMALFGIPFDPVTAIISALVVGVGVDYCIHLGERFVEDFEAADGDVAVALEASLQHTGAALAGAAFTTAGGFLVLLAASIVPFQRLGIVTIFAILGSLVATLLVLPPMLVLYGRRTTVRRGPSAPATTAQRGTVPDAAGDGTEVVEQRIVRRGRPGAVTRRVAVRRETGRGAAGSGT